MALPAFRLGGPIAETWQQQKRGRMESSPDIHRQLALFVVLYACEKWKKDGGKNRLLSHCQKIARKTAGAPGGSEDDVLKRTECTDDFADLIQGISLNAYFKLSKRRNFNSDNARTIAPMLFCIFQVRRSESVRADLARLVGRIRKRCDRVQNGYPDSDQLFRRGRAVLMHASAIIRRASRQHNHRLVDAD